MARDAPPNRRRWYVSFAHLSVSACLRRVRSGPSQRPCVPFDGRVSIYAKNLKTGAAYDLGGSNRCNTASSIKVPIMIGVFAAIEAGKVHWTDTSELTGANKVPGSGVLHEMSDGTKVPLRDLIRYMILLSDNTATNLVLDHVSGNEVNATMAKLGIEHTRSLRKILKGSTPEGVSEAGRDPANATFGIGVATPKEMVSLLERMYRGEIVSKAASEEMLGIMKKQIWRDGMPRRFDSIGVDVSDKPGALDHLRRRRRDRLFKSRPGGDRHLL
ncbi:MAG: serine hydrolase [Acidobacteriota bacterium]|nr:serine hydrolase [Acidobacteriota bacterium]